MAIEPSTPPAEAGSPRAKERGEEPAASPGALGPSAAGASPREVERRARLDEEALLAAFTDLLRDLAVDLARQTVEPALSRMHEAWQSEAARLRHETAEWTARVAASRQQFDEAVARQRELAREVYSTHARLLEEMAAFEKERRDALAWQQEVSAGLERLGELHRELAVEATRLDGMLKEIIAELARQQTEVEKRQQRLEARLQALWQELQQGVGQRLDRFEEQAAANVAALQQHLQETLDRLQRELSADRRENQETLARLGRELAGGQASALTAIRSESERILARLEAGGRKTLSTLLVVQALTLGVLTYLVVRIG